jgi:alpha-tubulin suppressor-like RCC1 family protein
LWCWGANSTQQLPINASSSSTPTKITFPQGAGPIQQVAVGNGHICATDGVKIYCWGANSPGQLGRGSSGNSSPDVQPVVEGKPPGTIASLIAGDGFTCALTTQDLNAGLYCWGTAPTYGTTSPTQVTDAFIAVAAGDQHICGVNENGYVYCAGNNDHGELGYKSPSTGYTDFTTPAVQDRAAQKPVNRVAAGGHHSAAMSASTLYLWGANAFGELSPSPPDPVNPPTMFGVKIDKIVFGNGHRCELSSGVVTCRGDQAKLGGGTANQDTSVKISLDPVADLAASHDATCAVTQAGALFCWGDAPIASGKTPTEIKLGP